MKTFCETFSLSRESGCCVLSAHERAPKWIFHDRILHHISPSQLSAIGFSSSLKKNKGHQRGTGSASVPVLLHFSLWLKLPWTPASFVLQGLLSVRQSFSLESLTFSSLLPLSSAGKCAPVHHLTIPSSPYLLCLPSSSESQSYSLPIQQITQCNLPSNPPPLKSQQLLTVESRGHSSLITWFYFSAVFNTLSHTTLLSPGFQFLWAFCLS